MFSSSNQAESAALRVPTFDQLMVPTLDALKSMGGSASNEELLTRVIEIMQVPDDVASVIHTDHRQTKLSYNLAWAKTYLKKAGAIDNSERGVWSITDLGEQLTPEDVAAIPSIIRKEDAERRKSEQTDPLEADQEPDDTDWKNALLSVLQRIPPAAFERLSQRVLREAGFSRVEVTGKSGDGGIDGVGILRANPLLSFTTLFQCKRYSGSVGPGAVRDFRGAMVGRSDKGLIITTGTFTAEARRESTRDGAPAIDLIDGDAFCDLLKTLGLGVKTTLIEEVTVDTEWFSSI